MGIEEEAAVRSFLTEREGAQWDSAQIDRLISHMAPDARYSVFAWEEPLIGHDAIRTELLRQAQGFRDLSNRVPDDRIRRADRLHRTTRLDDDQRQARDLPCRGRLRSGLDGKIAAWRDYLDSKEVAVKTGAEVSSAGTRS